MGWRKGHIATVTGTLLKARLLLIIMSKGNSGLKIDFRRLETLSKKKYAITIPEVREFMSLTKKLFDTLMAQAKYNRRQTIRLTTKFRDAGRRSAPWKAFSAKIPGRPQDGRDGNRINRWLLPHNHKFYADEKTATLVEIKYYYQALSMKNAPKVSDEKLSKSLVWLLGHEVRPGAYLDPIQKCAIDLKGVFKDPKLINSGHLIPLDRGGRHEPKNTFLMLKSSNSLQGNFTVDELIKLMDDIVTKHKKKIN